MTKFAVQHTIMMKDSKNTRKCFIKYKLKFDDYKNFLQANQLEKGINHLEKNLVKTWKS